MINSVVTTPANVPIQMFRASGMLISRVSMSLEKRLTIRPMGVVSKKDIGAWRMLASRSRCRMREALTHATARPNDMPIVAITAERQERQEVGRKGCFLVRSNFVSRLHYIHIRTLSNSESTVHTKPKITQCCILDTIFSRWIIAPDTEPDVGGHL